MVSARSIQRSQKIRVTTDYISNAWTNKWHTECTDKVIWHKENLRKRWAYGKFQETLHREASQCDIGVTRAGEASL